MPIDRLVYLATPYTHSQRSIMQQRYELACQIAGALIQKGHIIYSPIAHSHAIAQTAQVPGDWKTWQPQCEGILRRCDELWVARILGWNESVGIAAEIGLAAEMGKSISLLDPETLERRIWMLEAIA
jgi:Domain of unknown function (DUF1937)